MKKGKFRMNINKYVQMGKDFIINTEIRFGYLSKLGIYNYMSD